MKIGLTDGTPLTPTQYKIISRIDTLYAKATALGYIQKPLAWALYQVWKEVDKESDDKLDGDLIDTDKAIEHYEETLEVLKGIDLEVDG